MNRARIVAISLSLGLVCVMLGVVRYKMFELDRYFVPKELVLHVSALIIGAVLVTKRRSLHVDAVDILLAGFIAWSSVAALFASNHWLGQRALAVTISSAIIFWGGRMAAAEGLARPVISMAVVATFVVAITSLAQAYGVESEFFTLARAPGGTLGNRNFIAHVVAIGFPAAIWLTITSRQSWQAGLGSVITALLSATLVLSRSRAAWLAVAATTIVFLVLLLASLRYLDRKEIGGRLSRILLGSVIAAFLAIVIPNDLNWKSDSPYLDSAKKMVDYSSGSGQGRIAQYQNTLKMSVAHPVFGVGPGNWPVEYVTFAPAQDKSLSDNGMTANPWPSSDWMAFVSERGFAGAMILITLFASIFFRALRKWRDHPDGHAVLMQVMGAATVVSVMITSAFDAVLLLPAPAFLAFAVLGVAVGDRRSGKQIEIITIMKVGISAALLFIAASVARSATEVAAMAAVGTGGQTKAWIAGARLDPGSYRIHQRLADIYSSRRQCKTAAPYARRAIDLFPHSAPAKRTLKRCGIKT